MSRRRRIELYFAVAFTAAAASYLNHRAADPLAGPGPASVERHVVDTVFFLDGIFDHYGPTYGGWARRTLNMFTAACWGIGVGFLISLVLIDHHNRWRWPGRSDPPSGP